jgi:hypothetical protein
VIPRVLAACLLLALAVSTARAQAPQPTYVQFEPVGVKGALYRPDPARERDVGVLVIHRVNNFLGHLAAWRLVERGFIVLAMNSRFENNEASVIWEVLAQDVKTGVEYLAPAARHPQGGPVRPQFFKCGNLGNVGNAQGHGRRTNV